MNTRRSSRPMGLTGRSFAVIAIIEAGTWTGLLIGMFLKYVTETTDVGVKIFGWLHGIVFVVYLIAAIAAAIILRWRWWVAVVAVLAAVPPLVTIPLERWLARRGDLAPRTSRARSAELARRLSELEPHRRADATLGSKEGRNGYHESARLRNINDSTTCALVPKTIVFGNGIDVDGQVCGVDR